MRQRIPLLLIALFLAACAFAQRGPTGAREDGLDPTPVDAAVDPNAGMFLNDWRNVMPHAMYGQLAVRDILTSLEGPDPQHPTKKGAVLTAITAISYATLEPGAVISGKAPQGIRQVFYTTGGNGELTVNGKSWSVKDGTGFTLTPDFDFKLVSNGKEPLSFYVRIEPISNAYPLNGNIIVVNRFDNAERRVGAHWSMIGSGGPNGLSLITLAPHTMPQPHAHAGEECWIMVKGETLLSLGKNLIRMGPGQVYKIPPTGLAAHSNLNMGEEPVQMIFLGPLANGGGGGGRGAQPAAAEQGAPARGPQQGPDYARLDNQPYDRAKEPDIDMFIGGWRDGFPRMMHGLLYFRDMLTALEGPDSLHPARKGAVLTNATAVSYAMLEPGSTAHKIEGEMKGIQQTFVVNSGSGVITSGSQKVELSKDMAFVITPGLDFRLTATGENFMTFYVVSEKIPAGFTPNAMLEVADNRGRAPVMKAWVNAERPLITKDNGMSQYAVLNQVEMKDMTMSRPSSDNEGVEEIWIATEGDTEMLLGKQLRKLPAGTAYRVPSTGITAHANINASGKVARFLYLVK